MQLINVWGIRITLIHVAFQGPIVTHPKIVEPWRATSVAAARRAPRIELADLFSRA